MRRSGCSAANDLRSDRQIEAHDAVLEEADAPTSHHLSHHASDGEEEKGSGPLREFDIVELLLSS